MELQGIKRPVSNVIEKDNIEDLKKGIAKGIWLQIVEGNKKGSNSSISQEVQQVLNNFQGVFVEPKGLPLPELLIIRLNCKMVVNPHV